MLPYSQLPIDQKVKVDNAVKVCYDMLSRHFQLCDYPENTNQWLIDSQQIIADVSWKRGLEPNLVWYAFDLVTDADAPPDEWAANKFNNGSRLPDFQITYMC